RNAAEHAAQVDFLVVERRFQIRNSHVHFEPAVHRCKHLRLDESFSRHWRVGIVAAEATVKRGWQRHAGGNSPAEPQKITPGVIVLIRVRHVRLHYTRAKNGAGRSCMRSAAPIWPGALLPHPINAPAVSAAAWVSPAAIARTRSRPGTRVGTPRSALSFNPSWPWLFQPHA